MRGRTWMVLAIALACLVTLAGIAVAQEREARQQGSEAARGARRVAQVMDRERQAGDEAMADDDWGTAGDEEAQVPARPEAMARRGGPARGGQRPGAERMAPPMRGQRPGMDEMGLPCRCGARPGVDEMGPPCRCGVGPDADEMAPPFGGGPRRGLDVEEMEPPCRDGARPGMEEMGPPRRGGGRPDADEMAPPFDGPRRGMEEMGPPPRGRAVALPRLRSELRNAVLELRQALDAPTPDMVQVDRVLGRIGMIRFRMVRLQLDEGMAPPVGSRGCAREGRGPVGATEEGRGRVRGEGRDSSTRNPAWP
jgi:hypothetical protein